MNFKQYFTEAEADERLEVLRRATPEDFTPEDLSERPEFVKQLLLPGRSWVIKVINSTYPDGEEFVFYGDSTYESDIEYFNKEAGTYGGMGVADYKDQEAIKKWEFKHSLNKDTISALGELIDEL